MLFIIIIMFKKYKDYYINEDGVILGISGRIIKGTINPIIFYPKLNQDRCRQQSCHNYPQWTNLLSDFY